MFAAAMPFPHTLAAAFKAGVNPDEPDVFMNGGLLSYRHWFKTPALLELALKYGANPDVEVQHAPNKDTGSPGQVLRSSLQTARYGKESERLSDIQAIATLLRAGARRIGHVDDESRPGTLTHHASAAWLLAAASERTTAVVQDAMAGLVPLLRANGLDIDSPYMSAGTAPIVEAARARNRPMVEAFIQVGARTDDEHIAREARSSHVAVLSLHEEVEKAFGVEGVAWLTAALMSQRIGEIAQAESAPESRRRLRVI